MNQKDREKAEKWPIKNEFFVEIEDHSEDGSWSGYAHSEEFPKGSDSRKAVLLEPDTIQVPRELWEKVQKVRGILREVTSETWILKASDLNRLLSKAREALALLDRKKK